MQVKHKRRGFNLLWNSFNTTSSDLWLFSFSEDKLLDKTKIEAEQTNVFVRLGRRCLRHSFLLATSNSYMENSILAYADNRERWYRPTLNLRASSTSIQILWETIDQQIAFYTVIVLEHGVIKTIDHVDPQITNMTINHTNPCTMYEFSVGAKSEASNQFFDLGHIRYDGGVPAIPNVTYLGGAGVQVRWTTNPYCTPDFIHVHFREPEGIGLMKIVPGTDETTVLTGVKQCVPYAIQLGFSYTNGKEYLSETVNMTFLSGSLFGTECGIMPFAVLNGTFHNAPKLSVDQNGSLLVQWLMRPDCVVNHTIVMVETNGRQAKAHRVVGDQSLIRLDDLEHCAFHTVYVTIQYESGLVERTHSSEINTFMINRVHFKFSKTTETIGLGKIKTYIVDDELLADWKSVHTCHILGYRIDVVNLVMGETKTHFISGTEYRIPISECVKNCQLLVSAILVDAMVPITTLIDVRLKRGISLFNCLLHYPIVPKFATLYNEV
ncbi:uncharacterized protein DEA37_0000749 [Paragonimus westermani]|uniref:Uncharacterized protein n=1 Tax=Paragonimus westermani TaxID=34504 RepID=A0A5J4NXC0_9TREM|nr:uncharacterized protein DEA37_0000749 [Paragonimus westermani]